MKIWLDDKAGVVPKRTPDNSWTVVHNYTEFVNLIESLGLDKLSDIEMISFDHDLGKGEEEKELSGMECAKWLVNKLMDNNLYIKIPYQIHSQNLEGAKNIDSLLANWNRNIEKNASIIKQLVHIANQLDQKGFHKEANILDSLLTLPETGMGYQIIDIKLKDGSILKDQVAINGTLKEDIKSSDIIEIKLHE